MKRSTIILALPLVALACGPGSDGASRTVIQNKGSDTLVNVAQAWAERYGEIRPNTAVAVTGGGSGTGISGMINGTVDIANASRKMHDDEIAAARERGIDPVEFVVGFDALAVFLHPDNPITEMTIAQLASVYGESGTVESWDQLGVTIPGCPSGEIVRVSRQNNSGTYAYFQEAVLGEDEFKLGSRDMNGSKDVVGLVESTPCAIGYSGLAYATDRVTMPCISDGPGTECIAPSVESAFDRTYPIARPLLMYTAGTPQGAVKEYMDWILSDEGQCILIEKGYAPYRETACP
jgi:phosphate transport system substrate-binding protein